MRLATESWLDGCLGEGIAAARAARAASLASDPAALRVQRTIASDEARHAGSSAGASCNGRLEVGGDEVRDAVRELRDVEMGVPRTDGTRATERYGRLGPAHVGEVTERHCGRSRARLDGWM